MKVVHFLQKQCLKIFLFIFLGIISQFHLISANENGLANAQQVEIGYQKIHVNPSQVYFSQNEIFLLLDNGFVRIESLDSESGNIYAKVGYWICPRCGGKNELYTKHCQHCPYVLPW